MTNHLQHPKSLSHTQIAEPNTITFPSVGVSNVKNKSQPKTKNTQNSSTTI